ncbi:hypothetical protein HJG60_012039 [Phyllostomus discolor]|uniref:Uncharacterized protein n=1 Tax=Phyllostomus discolor TaxID=89673 RepID=A0A834DYN9_9CHIR|nr:hypothetical protein HJG60_012039 [Phyllostomus discolor]
MGLESGGGGRLALPGGGGKDTRAPPGTKVPSWLPGWQEVGTVDGGRRRCLICLPERGVPTVPRLSYPFGHCLRFGTAPWRESTPLPHGPLMTSPHPIPGPWSRALGAARLACSHPSVLACEGRGHGIPRPTGPSVSSSPLLLLPSPGAFLPEAGRGLRGALAAPPPCAPGSIWRQP